MCDADLFSGTVGKLRPSHSEGIHSLRDRQQVIAIHTLILSYLVIGADSTRVNHDIPLWVGLGVE